MPGNRFIEFFSILTYNCNRLLLFSQLKLTQGSFRESRALQQYFRSGRQSAWRTMDRGLWHYTGDRDQDHPQKKEMQKGKMAVWGGLTNSWEKKRSKKQRRKGKIYPFECRFQWIARRDKKAFLSDQCKEIDENNRMGKSTDLFKKIRDTKRTFHAKTGWIKDRNGMDLTKAEDIKKRWQEQTRSSWPR